MNAIVEAPHFRFDAKSLRLSRGRSLRVGTVVTWVFPGDQPQSIALSVAVPGFGGEGPASIALDPLDGFRVVDRDTPDYDRGSLLEIPFDRLEVRFNPSELRQHSLGQVGELCLTAKDSFVRVDLDGRDAYLSLSEFVVGADLPHGRNAYVRGWMLTGLDRDGGQYVLIDQTGLT